jgi:hypothetical protein
VFRDQLATGAAFAYCPQCGEKIVLPKAAESTPLTRQQADAVNADRRAAVRRSRFEQVLFRLKTYINERKISPPECFISYAWGDQQHEHWVERTLATDLQKAGITVLLDRWASSRIGANVARFAERIAKSDRVIVVGTPAYRTKYENTDSTRGFVVAAEGDLINQRMKGTEAQKESVLPVLLEGTEESAFPPLLRGRVYADLRVSNGYFAPALELLLTLYAIAPGDAVAVELRQSLQQDPLDGPR